MVISYIVYGKDNAPEYIDLFAQILFTMGEKPDDDWYKQYIINRQYRIEKHIPFIDFHFDSLTLSLEN